MVKVDSLFFSLSALLLIQAEHLLRISDHLLQVCPDFLVSGHYPPVCSHVFCKFLRVCKVFVVFTIDLLHALTNLLILHHGRLVACEHRQYLFEKVPYVAHLTLNRLLLIVKLLIDCLLVFIEPLLSALLELGDAGASVESTHFHAKMINFTDRASIM